MKKLFLLALVPFAVGCHRSPPIVKSFAPEVATGPVMTAPVAPVSGESWSWRKSKEYGKLPDGTRWDAWGRFLYYFEFDSKYIYITAKNATSESMDNVSFTWELQDSSGAKIGTTVTLVGHLSAGQTYKGKEYLWDYNPYGVTPAIIRGIN